METKQEYALTVQLQAMSLQDTMTLGQVLARSGYFSDAKDQAQAVVKVLAGRELGFGPVASMTGIHIVQGKPVVGGNLIATLVQAHPVFSYRVTHMADDRVEIAFFEGKAELGRSQFSMEDAKTAGLTGKSVWKQYPRNMLFARAMSNGARWYCPAVFAGVTVYTPEELGAEVDGETGEIIDVIPTPAPAAKPTPQPEQPTQSPLDEAFPRNGGEDIGPQQVQERVDKLLAAIEAKLPGRYNHVRHMLNTIRLEKGDDKWTWPTTSDGDTWNALFKLLVTHAGKEG